MQILTTIEQIRAWRSGEGRFGTKSLAFVPTMGYLHDGHISLVRRARECAESVLMSIYVNPTQFNSSEDLIAYPRNLERDAELARDAGVDVLYVPDDAEIYNADYDVSKAVRIKAGYLAEGFCGKHRPGHFDGVVLVVAKLFNIVQPDVAIFGEKDYQQLQVIRQMVRDLCFPVKIVAGELIREEDGLALSSRNVRLSAEERLEALKISQALFAAKERYIAGEVNASALLNQVREILETIVGGGLEYAEIVDAATLLPLELINCPARLLVAVWVGKVRLIDNVALDSSVMAG